jgi:hypothetical protein
MKFSLRPPLLTGTSGPRVEIAREPRRNAKDVVSPGKAALGLTVGLALAMTLGAGAACAAGGTAKPTKVPPPAPIIVAVPPPPAVPAPVFSAAVTDIHGFQVTGFIQDATVSATLCPGLPASQRGGTAMINGLTITIPCNTILQMPAATLTWAQLFDKTKFPEPLSLFDIAASPSSSVFKYPSTEISIVGNIVAGRHIAGLVLVSQQSLNLGIGYITRIDYAAGAIFVGGAANGPDRARLVINDPNGRYGRAHSPDARFSVDEENPTIKAATGYPMCVPRTDPATADDALCPRRNRPLAAAGCRNFATAGVVSPAGWELSPPAAGQLYCSAFVMEDPNSIAVTSPGSTRPDAKQQAPFKVGDFIAYSGTLLRDGSGVGGAATISVHTIEANVGIFTQPHTLPVYLAIGQFVIGMDTAVTAINGLPQEVQNRLVLEASVTDVTSVVDVYLVDVDPVTGKETQRWITPESMTGSITPGTPPYGGGITTQLIGPQPGRARIRADKATPGILVSPTRSVRVVARQLCTPDRVNAVIAGVPCLQTAPAANGLFAGQYLAPTLEYIFPENIVAGDAVVPNNLWDLGFLVNGEGPGTGRLVPTPW